MERGRVELATALSLFVTALFVTELGCSAASPGGAPNDGRAPSDGREQARAPISASARAPDDAPSAPKPEPRRAIAWGRSEPEAREKARREGRAMIVYLRADWAVMSVRMERDVWSDARVEREVRALVPLMIDLTEADGDAELYAARYDVPRVPATIVIDERGARVAVLTGDVTIEALLEALKRASE